jgi:hypothetical protein
MLKVVNMRVEENLYDQFKELIKGETITSALTRLIREEVNYRRLQLKSELPRVIRIIDGKKYDTDTARMVSEVRYNSGLVTILYKKKNGEIFIHCYNMRGNDIDLPAIITDKHDKFDYYLAQMHIDAHSAKKFEE